MQHTKITVIVYTLAISAIATGVKVTRLNNTSGIFFEENGKVSLFADEWKIITFYNLNDFKMELENLQNITAQINYLCINWKANKTNNVPLCNILPNNQRITHICDGAVRQLNTMVSETKQKNTPLEMRPRHKRGLFNAIGTLSKTLFGTLDDIDAQTYNEHIANLTTNQHHLLSLITKQTSIIEATNNILNKTIQNIEDDFNLMTTKLANMEEYLKEACSSTQENGASIELESLISLATLILLRYQDVQTQVLDLISDTQHGKFHPIIIS